VPALQAFSTVILTVHVATCRIDPAQCDQARLSRPSAQLISAAETAVTAVQPYPIVSNLIDRFGDWLKQRRELNELSELDGAEFRRMAHELGLAPSDLDAIVRKGVNGAEELPQMLRALGFSEAAIAGIQPPQMMEMRHACAGCKHKRACGVDLAAKTAPANYENYCANTNDIALLAQSTK
jgi:uncharacterized protein YjiS (DUF1127 family)